MVPTTVVHVLESRLGGGSGKLCGPTARTFQNNQTFSYSRVAISVGVVVLICIGIVLRFYIYRRRRSTVITTHALSQPVGVTTSQQQQQQYVTNPPAYERFQ